MSKPVAWVRPRTLEWYQEGQNGCKSDVSSIDMAIIPYGEYTAPIYAQPHDATTEIEVLRKALEPFADIADRDIGEDEADSDIFTPMSKYNRVPRPTVGMFRAARAALARAGGRQ